MVMLVLVVIPWSLISVSCQVFFFLRESCIFFSYCYLFFQQKLIISECRSYLFFLTESCLFLPAKLIISECGNYLFFKLRVSYFFHRKRYLLNNTCTVKYSFRTHKQAWLLQMFIFTQIVGNSLEKHSPKQENFIPCCAIFKLRLKKKSFFPA